MQTSMAALEPRDSQAMLLFDGAPGRYVTPDRLAAATGLPLTLAGELVARERFSDRLSALLIARLRLPSCRDASIDERDRTLALQPPDKIASLPRLFGCLWHGATIRHVIARDSRRRLIEAIGPDLYAFILRHPSAGGAAPFEATLSHEEQIERHGWELIEHWLTGLPRAFAERIRLMLPLALERGVSMTPPNPATMSAIIGAARRWLAESVHA